jgi:hypothetical protein
MLGHHGILSIQTIMAVFIKVISYHHDDVRFIEDQHAYVGFVSASSLKQQSTGKHIAPRGHIILNSYFIYLCFIRNAYNNTVSR